MTKVKKIVTTKVYKNDRDNGTSLKRLVMDKYIKYYNLVHPDTPAQMIVEVVKKEIEIDM